MGSFYRSVFWLRLVSAFRLVHHRFSLLLAGWVLLVLLGASSQALLAASEPDGAVDASHTLHDLIDREWAFRLAEFPTLATSVGVHDTDHLLADVRVPSQRRRAETWRGFLEESAAIDPQRLSEEDLINQAIFEDQLEGFVAEFESGHYRMPLTVDDGFHIAFARLPGSMRFAGPQDYQNYMARLRAFPEYVAQHIVLMTEGLEHGMTLPRVVLEGYDVTITTHIVEDPEDSLFYGPFEAFPTSVPEDQRDSLRQAGRQAILEGVVPGYQAFLDFMRGTYIPGARTTLGASEFPDGAAYYAQRIRHFTTLDLSADEIHQIGLEEVARIRAEMQDIIEEVEFEGSFADFLTFLRTDPRFYAETPEELLKEASYLSKKMDAQLPSLFGKLPRMPYGVAPVPDHLAPKYTTGRYVGTSPGSTQPGYYWVNTYALETRPLYVLPALTLHEAVPGHHLQIALNQERNDLPPFRRYSYLSAFGEGWALYAEWLGLEAGMYPDPYSRFGRLTYEMWRACRLVVDTGLHAKGWGRQQVIDYMASNTALSLHEVTTETDRYISWPAQALAYKLGELKIRELRRRAEERLGPDFDIRAFHDMILHGGSVPLSVLESIVERWIASQERS